MTTYRYTDKTGETLTGTLEQIGHALLWGVWPGQSDAATPSDDSGIYYGYGVGAIVDNPEPWLTADDDDNEVPAAFSVSDWLDWAARVENVPSVAGQLAEVVL